MHVTNIMPMLMSLVALMFSGYSLYESALRAPQLSIFVAPRIDYTDPDRPEAVRDAAIQLAIYGMLRATPADPEGLAAT